jgi:hypothetical protein
MRERMAIPSLPARSLLLTSRLIVRESVLLQKISEGMGET